MASFKLLKLRLDDIENICCELKDRIATKDLWADNKIYAIAAVAHNTLDELIRQKRRIAMLTNQVKHLKQEIKELKNEVKELGANCSMHNDDDI